MPIPAFNYAMIPAQGDPILDAIVPGLLKGMKLVNLPQQQRQEAQKNQLANALAQIQLQYAPQQAQSDIALKQAQTANIPVQSQIEQSKLQMLMQKLKQGQNQPNPQQQKQQLIDYKNQLTQNNLQNNEFNKMIADASDQAKSANLLGSYAQQFHDAYNKTKETGALFGRLPAASSDAQTADRFSNLMVVQMLNLLKGGRITNSQLAFLQSLKPNRTLNKESENDAINQLKAVTARTKELLPFLSYAQSVNLSPNDAKLLWQKYDEENPLYDVKKGAIKSENMGNWKKFIDNYLSKNSSQQRFNTSSESIINPKSQQKIIDFAKYTHAPGLRMNNSNISPEDLEFTARKYGMSIEQVKQKLGIQ